MSIATGKTAVNRQVEKGRPAPEGRGPGVPPSGPAAGSTGRLEGGPESYSIGPPKYKTGTKSQKNVTPVQVLHAQVDTLYHSYHIDQAVLDELRPVLQDLKERAQAGGDNVYRFKGTDGADLFMAARGRGPYSYLVTRPGVGEIAVIYHAKFPPVRLRVFSEYLAGCVDYEAASRAAQELVGALFGPSSVRSVQVSAVHVAVDVVGWVPTIKDIMTGRFTCPAGDPKIEDYNRQEGIAHSLRWGGSASPISCAIYNKPKEIAEQSKHKEYLLDLYKAAGWDGVQPVYRVEFRFNRDELRRCGVELPADVDLAGLLRFGMEWLMLRDKPKAKHRDSAGDVNRSRWPVAEVWGAIYSQGAALLVENGVLYVREPRIERDLDRLVAMAGGVVASIAALAGKLDAAEAFRFAGERYLTTLRRRDVKFDAVLAGRRDRYMLPAVLG